MLTMSLIDLLPKVDQGREGQFIISTLLIGAYSCIH